MTTLLRLGAGVTLALLVTSCSGATAPRGDHDEREHADEHEHEHAEGHESLPRRVRLEPSVAQAAGVKLVPARVETLAATVDLTGELAPDPDRTAIVAAQVPGRLVQVRFREGERVRKGAALAVLESAELARARAALSSASARAAAAKQNAERLEALARDGFASGQELSTARAEATSLEADAMAARQTLAAFGAGALDPSEHPARLTLRAPIDGTVLERNAIVGETVGPAHPVARIADLERAYFVARLFEKNLASVREGQKADVRLNAYQGEVFSGVVETVGRQLDPAARTVVARIAVGNQQDRFKVGLFGTARLAVGAAASARSGLVVPIGAVTRLGDRQVVFVQEPDGMFEVHPVTLGQSAGGLVEVLEGLSEGEQVVAEGVFSVKSVVLKGQFGEEDHH